MTEQAITPTVTFNPANRTIDFSAYTGFDIRNLYQIFNITRNTKMYECDDWAYGFTSIASSLLTLKYDTTSMASNDVLQILYDVSSNNVGGFTTASQATPTVQAAAYASGQSIGGLISLTNAARTAAGSGLVQSITASFSSGVTPSLDVVLFNANPTGSTITDKTAVAIVAADLAKVIAVVHLTDANTLGATSLIQAEQQAVPFNLPAGTTLYAAVIARATPTLTSTSDMILTARILQD